MRITLGALLAGLVLSLCVATAAIADDNVPGGNGSAVMLADDNVPGGNG